MRVLYFASYFPRPSNDRVGTWALVQARALARQPDTVVRVIAPIPAVSKWSPSRRARSLAKNPDRYTWPGGVDVDYPRWIYYPADPLRRIAWTWPRTYLNAVYRASGRRLMRLATAFGPDVIMANHSIPDGYIAARLAIEVGVPLVVVDHSTTDLRRIEMSSRLRAAYSEVVGRAGRMLAVSSTVASMMSELGASALVVPNAVDVPDPGDAPLMRAKAAGPVVFCAANLSERKGVHILLQAFADLGPSHSAAVLRIAGDGPERLALEALVARQDLTDRVVMLGSVGHDEVLAEMAHADVFALLSWDEPFGVVYLEALAAETPIMCTDEAGICDVVVHGVHAIVVPARDVDAATMGLDTLLSDVELRAQMGLAGRQLVACQLNSDAQASRLTELFREVAAEESKHP